MADCTNKRKSGHQEDINSLLLGLVVRHLGSSPLSSKILCKERARHPMHPICEGKGCTAGRAFLYGHVRRFLERWTTGGSRHQCYRNVTGIIGTFLGTTASGGRGARSSVACPTN